MRAGLARSYVAEGRVDDVARTGAKIQISGRVGDRKFRTARRSDPRGTVEGCQAGGPTLRRGRGPRLIISAQDGEVRAAEVQHDDSKGEGRTFAHCTGVTH